MTEQERSEAYRAAVARLPKPDLSGWAWTDEEVAILRKACAVRFDECIRTESLFYIAMAGIRIAASRGLFCPAESSAHSPSEASATSVTRDEPPLTPPGGG